MDNPWYFIFIIYITFAKIKLLLKIIFKHNRQKQKNKKIWI